MPKRPAALAPEVSGFGNVTVMPGLLTGTKRFALAVAAISDDIERLDSHLGTRDVAGQFGSKLREQ